MKFRTHVATRYIILQSKHVIRTFSWAVAFSAKFRNFFSIFQLPNFPREKLVISVIIFVHFGLAWLRIVLSCRFREACEKPNVRAFQCLCIKEIFTHTRLVLYESVIYKFGELQEHGKVDWLENQFAHERTKSPFRFWYLLFAELVYSDGL